MFLLFWPAVMIAVLLSFIAIWTKKPLFFVIAFFLVIPFSVYLAGTPIFYWWGLLIPFLFLIAAFTLKKEKLFLSFLLTSPVILLFGVIGIFVLIQPSVL